MPLYSIGKISISFRSLAKFSTQIRLARAAQCHSVSIDPMFMINARVITWM